MRLTPALYVRQLLARLHPPVPPTLKDSQRLLNVLESSFRKHLDEVHPSPNGHRDDPNSKLRSIPLSPIDSSHATNHHLNSVLTHPLLDKPSTIDEIKHSYVKAAIGRFDSATAQDQVDFGLLVGCAKQYMAGIWRGERGSGEQKLASKITSWLYSASPSTKEAFFLNSELIRCVVPVMAADEQEGTVWNWLRMLYERDFGRTAHQVEHGLQSSGWLKAEDTLVSSLMQLSILRKEMDDAATQFVQACQYRAISGRATATQESPSSGLKYVPMAASWKRLAAAIIRSRGHHNISADLFSNALRYSLPWAFAPHFSEPVVTIYHPSSPSAELLCRNLRHVMTAATFLDAQKKASKAVRKAMIVVLLDGAQLSLDQSLRQDAEFLLDFAAAQYPDMLPAHQKEQQQEESLQHRLDNLKETLEHPLATHYHVSLT